MCSVPYLGRVRYRLTIAYDGTDFHGWQRQLQPEAAAREHGHDAPADAEGRVELRTVQGVLAQAIAEVIRQPVHVQGASRTDSGVHARCQTAAFSASDDRLGPSDERLARAINSRLPEDVVVRGAVRVGEDFDPIADCVVKGYRYSLFSSESRPLWDRRTLQHVHERLDVGAMREAGARLVGEHDFAGFAAAGHGRESTVRTLVRCDVSEETPGGEGADARVVRIDVAGDGFLYNMVRIIAGTLLEVGRGKKSPEDVAGALASLDRRQAGPTLAPAGLCLQWSHYLGDDPARLESHCVILAPTLERLTERALARHAERAGRREHGADAEGE